ncbi:hypothetical protein DYB28_013221 [Aphanomyces astaci]|uniref:Uncharacterized protein n=1 Tax=Aphanomyces astaci TaxID=112090 RepID=A0A9X8DSZ6_APHAT|nr:hypothetical protein DYB28_013221 [Aphanomyces astaci]
MEFPGTGNEHTLDVELPGSDHGDSVRARSRSDRSTSPVARTPCVGRFEDRGRPRASATARQLFRSPQGRRQPVAADEAWSYARVATFAAPGFGGTSGTAPGPTLDKEDVDMGQNDVHLHNTPALPKNPTFKGSTKEERRVFMAAYNLYIGQTNSLSANGVLPFIMPVRACIEPATKQRIAEWDMGKDPDDVSEGEWIAWFKQGYDIDPRALDTLKKRIKSAVVFDMSVPDADSRIGRMLDGLAAAIRRDRQEWVIREESQVIVKIITDAVKPASLHRYRADGVDAKQAFEEGRVPFRALVAGICDRSRAFCRLRRRVEATCKTRPTEAARVEGPGRIQGLEGRHEAPDTCSERTGYQCTEQRLCEV